MRFYSLTLKAMASGTRVINTFWYRQLDEGLPTQADLEELVYTWRLGRLTNWLSLHTAQYLLETIEVQGYGGDWERFPYHPHVETVNEAGTDATPSGPPVVALILSAKVQPIADAPRLHPTLGRILTPVRRGYWAVSPVNEAIVLPDGSFSEYAATGGAWYEARVQAASPLSPPAWIGDAAPIVVSSPLTDEVQRGYGLIVSCTWGRSVSTRRSRKLGVGA